MERVLIKNIGTLFQVRETPIQNPLCTREELSDLPAIENAYMAIEKGVITDFGSMDDLSGVMDWRGLEIIDAEGQMVLPGWVDSHTHMIFAATREEEYGMRLAGKSYQEIALAGGGILNSARKLREMDEEQLFKDAQKRIWKAIATGTTCIEIKSGYGLSLESELKMLRVGRRLQAEMPIIIKTTFLAAHAIPDEFKGNSTGYIDHIIYDMLPRVAAEKLADYVDVFCEEGYFSVSETMRVVSAAHQVGLKAKVHVNQFTSLGAVKQLADFGALSLDHLEEMSEEDFSAMAKHKTLGVALPGCSFFLGIPYTPVQAMMDRGIPVVLATDFNPGSTPCYNMNTIHTLACTQMKMTPEQAINAATVNAAFALEVEEQCGSITIGKRADLIFLKPGCPNLSYLSYSFGENHIDQVMIAGKILPHYAQAE